MNPALQDPLDVVGQMIEEWRSGHEIVYGQRIVRDGETWLKKVTAFGFYRVMSQISKDPTPRDVGDFYLLGRIALDKLKSMREPNRYLRGMVFWLGFEPKCIRYHRHVRAGGVTKFNYRRMMAFAMDGILSSSSFPLVLASYMGMFSAFLGSLVAIRNLYVWMFDENVVPGWSHTVMLILFVGGVQLATIGILGLYLARVYDQVRGRPLYLLRDSCGPPTPDAEGLSEHSQVAHDYRANR